MTATSRPSAAVSPARAGRAEVAVDGLESGVAVLGPDLAIDAKGLRRLEAYATLLREDSLAPTSVRDPRGIVEDHLLDSLVGLTLAPVRTARSIVDVGSGAGLPGIPLAVALPNAHVTLVEGNRRKAAFLTRAVEACELVHVDVVPVRAEVWTEGFGHHDLVTARAVDRLSVVCEYAAPLLSLGGWLVAWRGRRDADDEAEAGRAAETLGLELDGVVHVTPYEGAESRHLHVIRKVAETSERFPRRPGVARKRPLGAAGGPRATAGRTRADDSDRRQR